MAPQSPEATRKAGTPGDPQGGYPGRPAGRVPRSEDSKPETRNSKPERSEEIVLRFTGVGYDGATEDQPALFESLDFTLVNGEALVLTGLVSSGKSTVLRIALGAARPHRGQVRLWGRDPAGLNRAETVALRRKVGYMPQTGALLSNLTLYDNLVLPLRFHLSLSEEEIRGVADEVLELVGLGPLPALIPALVSRNICRRVALARALTLRPTLLILDDPTEDFDPRSAREVWSLLGGLRMRLGLTILAAANDPDPAEALAGRFIDLPSLHALPSQTWIGSAAPPRRP